MKADGFGTDIPIAPGAFLPPRELTDEEQRISSELNGGDSSPDSWENLENTDVPKDLQADLDSGEASVLYWRALIMPVRPQKKSKGGIILVDESRQNAQYLTYIGKIVALGPLWGQGANFKTDSPLKILPQLKPGDWVLYGRHAGQRVEYKGVKLLLVNDDDKLMKIRSPEGWRIYT